MCFCFDVVFSFRLSAPCCLAGTKPSVLLLLLVYVMNVPLGGRWERFAVCESKITAQQCSYLFSLCVSHCSTVAASDNVDSLLTSVSYLTSSSNRVRSFFLFTTPITKNKVGFPCGVKTIS